MRHTRSPRTRRHRAVASAVLVSSMFGLLPNSADAKPKVRFGLGGGLGDPLGPSLKLFVHPQHALQFDLGWAPMHNGDGITHVNYLFHFKPFVEHPVFDFGMYLGAGIGVAFWGPARRGCYYVDEPGPGRGRCGYYDYYYDDRYYWRRRDGGAAMIARAPVGLFFHWQDVPIDTVVEGGWSPYVSYWDPFHGDFSIKVRYYF